MAAETAPAADVEMIDLPAGTFRTLTWEGSPDRTVLFLHGLSGAADVWQRTVTALGPDRPHCIALDLRGHGHSPHTPGHYAVSDHLGDVLALTGGIDAPIDLVGHSMGARIAMVAGARNPGRFRSVAVVDIGPEAWKKNIETTTRLLTARPERLADRTEALAVAGLIVDRLGIGDAEGYVRDRMVENDDGSWRWRSPAEALVESVTTQRARDHWRDWERLRPPALLVRGGTSNEVRPRIANEMRRRNPAVRYHEIPDVGHNIPLLAPETLAGLLREFWSDRPDPT